MSTAVFIVSICCLDHGSTVLSEGGGIDLLKLDEKKQVVAEIKERLEKTQGAVLADYRGLNVAEATELRTKLREAGVEYKVLKNTLIRIAAQDIGLEGLDPYLEGPTAIAFSFDDPVISAKVISEFAKTHKALEIKAGILENKVIDLQSVKELADLPAKEVLLAKVLGSMQSPMYGFAGALQGLLRNLVYVLDAVREKKAAEA
ncbi:MAG: 50S ribosomal protein L10 [Firmicutes bacterium HGW-Firmicutes-14]|nr:MAG: 50S ribosomal protein L10 [Firmicutes bacterium HGW-Firmicutes-14]